MKLSVHIVRTWALMMVLGLAIQGCATVLGTGQTGTPEPAPAPSDPAPRGPVVVVALDSHFISEPQSEDMPRTEVVLLWGPVGGDKTQVVVDTTYGGCSVPPWMEDVELDDYELAFLLCWHAGEGMDYRLSRDGDDLTVDRSYTSEDPDAYDESDGEVHRLSFEPGTEFRPAKTP